MAWWSDLGKKVALTVLDEKIEPLDKRILEIEKDHRMILDRLEKNEARLGALENRLRVFEIGIAKVEGALETIPKLLPPHREGNAP